MMGSSSGDTYIMALHLAAQLIVSNASVHAIMETLIFQNASATFDKTLLDGARVRMEIQWVRLKFRDRLVARPRRQMDFHLVPDVTFAIEEDFFAFDLEVRGGLEVIRCVYDFEDTLGIFSWEVKDRILAEVDPRQFVTDQARFLEVTHKGTSTTEDIAHDLQKQQDLLLQWI